MWIIRLLYYKFNLVQIKLNSSNIKFDPLNIKFEHHKFIFFFSQIFNDLMKNIKKNFKHVPRICVHGIYF